MNITTIVGARPQFIKAAVLSRLIRQTAEITETIIHTGQHYDARMSDIFFEELDLQKPDYSLGVGSGPQGEQTGRMMSALEPVLLDEQPDVVLVYGDTNSTLAGALTAVKLQFPVAHVEAGLRSFDRSMPEEINRCVTDHVSRWHFCPTATAVQNLRQEGITQNAFHVGDVMYDALLYYTQGEPSAHVTQLCDMLGNHFALCTLHRAGNTDCEQRFRQLWEGIGRLSEIIPVLLPLHPRTRNVIERLQLPGAQNVHVIEPVGYLDMLHLEQAARIIVTDSGGVQKEAYMHGVPCLTLRDNTEWTETIDAGWNGLVGHDTERLLAEAQRFLGQGPPADHPPLYGDGNAGGQILGRLLANVDTSLADALDETLRQAG